MKANTTKLSASGNKYDALSILVILIAAVLIVAICLWFDYQNSRIENDLIKFR